MDSTENIIEIRGLRTVYGRQVVHDGIDMDVRRGEIFALVGGSGSGKTTLMHEVIMLRQATAGRIRVFGQEIERLSASQQMRMRSRFGVLFQYGALFSGMSVLQNVAFPLHEHTDLEEDLIEEIAALKIVQAGLPLDAANKYPSQLSGGMIKRAALARAMALDPEILFLDEPTSGLDPQSAGAFDELVLNLKNLLGLTIMMVTHDLDTLWKVTDRVAVLGNGKLAGVGHMNELVTSESPAIQGYFAGPRGRAAQEAVCNKT